MALSAKPKPKVVESLDAFIDKGGSVAAPTRQPGKTAQHPLKFPASDLFERMERARSAATVKLPRNTWILQAIAEKLAREGME